MVAFAFGLLPVGNVTAYLPSHLTVMCAEVNKPKRGRPTKDAAKLTRSINLKLTEADFTALRQKAGSLGLTATQYARHMALNGKIVDRYTKEQLDLRRKIAGEANNLNQLAKLAHTNGFTVAWREVVSVTAKLKTLLDDR